MTVDGDRRTERGEEPVGDVLTTLSGLLGVNHDPAVPRELHSRCRLDLSWAAIDLVRVVGEMAPVTIADVATAVHRPEREILRLVQELQHRGLVVRRPDRRDRRRLRLILTPAGRQADRTRHRVLADAARRVLRDRDPDDAQALTELLVRCTRGLADLGTGDARP